MNLDDTSRQIRIHVDEFLKMASGLIFKLCIAQTHSQTLETRPNMTKQTHSRKPPCLPEGVGSRQSLSQRQEFFGLCRQIG